MVTASRDDTARIWAPVIEDEAGGQGLAEFEALRERFSNQTRRRLTVDERKAYLYESDQEARQKAAATLATLPRK